MPWTKFLYLLSLLTLLTCLLLGYYGITVSLLFSLIFNILQNLELHTIFFCNVKEKKFRHTVI